MKTYIEMKNELLKTKKNIKYFTEEFYNTFIKEYRDDIQCRINNKNIETYVKTKKSEFYIKNTRCYCSFLVEFNNSLQKFRITYSKDSNSDDLRVYDYAEDEETMKKIVLAEMKEPYRFFEIMAVK